MRVLVAGVGYRDLRDHSVGPEVVERLARRPWADQMRLSAHEVVVEDLSYNPIAVVQRLEDEPPDRRFARAVVVGAVARGRPPAAITAYRWDAVLPSPDEIQRAVTEAVTGVIALDNTVVVAGHFGAWPLDVAVVEVEPVAHEFGDAFSAPVAAVLDAVCDLVARVAVDAAAFAILPVAGLGATAGLTRAV